MTVLFVLAALGVVLAIGLLAVGRLGELPPVEPDRTPDRLPGDRPLAAPDVDEVRFDVGLRGYRMDEVDDVLDRVAADLAARDAIIADLRARLGEPADVEVRPDGPGDEPEEPGEIVARAAESAGEDVVAGAVAAPESPTQAPG